MVLGNAMMHDQVSVADPTVTRPYYSRFGCARVVFRSRSLVRWRQPAGVRPPHPRVTYLPNASAYESQNHVDETRQTPINTTRPFRGPL